MAPIYPPSKGMLYSGPMSAMDASSARRILGLSPGASEDEVKRAYRRLARQHHPDVGGDEEAFVRIQQAYDLLAGPAAGAHHDTGRGPAAGADVEARLAALRREVDKQAQRARRAAADARGQAHTYASSEPDDSLGAVLRDAFTEAGKRLESLFEQDEPEPQTLKDRLKGRLSDLNAPAGTPEEELTPAQRELARLKRLISNVAERSQGPGL
jgi:curved DNA-binding protein CbpA